jgi:hypothetical protein
MLMAGLTGRPDKPIAIAMTATAALLICFGIITFAREGWGWFSWLWLAAGLIVLSGFVRRFFVARRTVDDTTKGQWRGRVSRSPC